LFVIGCDAWAKWVQERRPSCDDENISYRREVIASAGYRVLPVAETSGHAVSSSTRNGLRSFAVHAATAQGDLAHANEHGTMAS
jgi:hypothetical protein